MPSNGDIVSREQVHSRSSTGNNTIQILSSNAPKAPARTPRHQRGPLSITLNHSSSAKPADMEESRMFCDNMPSSPGEIISESSSHYTHLANGSRPRTDEEKYRDLNAIDLVIVIDMQQALLDQLNWENRDYNGKFRNLQTTVQALVEENNRLHAALNMKIKHSNVDNILQQTSNDIEEKPVDGTRNPEITPSAVDLLAAEKTALGAENETLREELGFRKQQLMEKTRLYDEAAEKAAKLHDPKHYVDLEDLTQSLRASINRLRQREDSLLEEVLGLKESAARLSSENGLLKDSLVAVKTEMQTQKINGEITMNELQNRHRKILEELTEQHSREIAEKLAALVSSTEQIQNLTAALHREESKCQIISSDRDIYRVRAEDGGEAAASTLRRLAVELAECKQQLATAQECHLVDKQTAQSELKHHLIRQRLAEEHLRGLRLRLQDAEVEGTNKSQENAQLILRIAHLEKTVTAAAVSAPSSAEASEKLFSWLSTEVHRLYSLRELEQKDTLAGDNDLAGLVHSQASLVERLKTECDGLLTKWERSERRRKSFLVRSKSLVWETSTGPFVR